MLPLIHFSDPPPPAKEDRTAPERAIGPAPLRRTVERYAASGGALSVGEWSCPPGAWRIRFHAGRHEFVLVMRGRIRITGGDGVAREIGPGEACVIPAGFEGVFEVLEAVDKRYVMLDTPRPSRATEGLRHGA